jgi:hypothetical protein
MKKNLLLFSRSISKGLIALILILITISFCGLKTQAQIYEPEGLNMPGAWNGWTNPPANNLALASSTQVTGGRIIKIAVGTTRWQTSFSVAATGADLIGGTYDWLFTSGSSSNYFQNKWSNVTVAMNTLQTYTKEGANNNNITLVDNKWYTVNWEDLGYQDSRAIFMETSSQPVDITGVSGIPATANANTAVTISVTAGATPAAGEIIYLRYTTDAWATSLAIPVTMTGANGTVQIPGQAAGTTVSFYIFTSTVSNITADFDLYSINIENNAGLNYSYSVAPPPPAITWANLQFPASGAIETAQAFEVYGQALIPGVTGQPAAAAGLQGWIGYSTSNTDPATWTNWIPATYNQAAGNNDEFKGDLGTAITVAGTYYYATRFQLNTDAYVYGGYNGGFWDGTTNISGTLTVTDPIPDPDFDWVNLQHPGTGTIVPTQEYIVYAQAFIQGVTGQATPAAGVQSWIGYSTTNSNPATWTNWVPAPYSSAVGNNDEFTANIGALLSATGTYYYASRFQLNTGNYYYGGYSATGGGFWDGTANVSGVVEVTEPGSGIDWANLQFPGSDTIAALDNFDVYAQVFINGVTGQPAATPGMQAWIGYSSTNTDPATWTNWVSADYNMASGNNDEFKANIGTEFTSPGIYYYASRFQLNTGAFVYGGYNAGGGGFWDGITNISGILTVTEPVATYPVLFTIIDGTLNNTNIKFKGEMTAWDTVSMSQNNNTWTLTLNVAPGTYKWGAIEDDGSPSGIWLIEGPDLEVTVDESGVVTGTVTYTTLITGLDETVAQISVYPNPTTGTLYLDIPHKAVIRITDMHGAMLLQKESMGGVEQLDLTDFRSGIYNLEIRNGVTIRKFSVIKK